MVGLVITSDVHVKLKEEEAEANRKGCRSGIAFADLEIQVGESCSNDGLMDMMNEVLRVRRCMREKEEQWLLEKYPPGTDWGLTIHLSSSLQCYHFLIKVQFSLSFPIYGYT